MWKSCFSIIHEHMNSVCDSMEIVNDSMECMVLLRISSNSFFFGQNKISWEQPKRHRIHTIDVNTIAKSEYKFDSTANWRKTKKTVWANENLLKLKDDESVFGWDKYLPTQYVHFKTNPYLFTQIPFEHCLHRQNTQIQRARVLVSLYIRWWYLLGL